MKNAMNSLFPITCALGTIVSTRAETPFLRTLAETGGGVFIAYGTHPSRHEVAVAIR
ncbi:MAG: hypothetical protein GF350_13425 [Chitinivibrionales bacterium]|nr:hypothetical protein [Chitinivibrionales bacterium]